PALRVAEGIRLAALRPDEHEVGRCHELGDEIAPRRRAGKGIGADAEPPRMVRRGVVLPELLFPEELDVLQEDPPRPRRLHRPTRLATAPTNRRRPAQPAEARPREAASG